MLNAQIFRSSCLYCFQQGLLGGASCRLYPEQRNIAAAARVSPPGAEGGANLSGEMDEAASDASEEGLDG